MADIFYLFFSLGESSIHIEGREDDSEYDRTLLPYDKKLANGKKSEEEEEGSDKLKSEVHDDEKGMVMIVQRMMMTIVKGTKPTTVGGDGGFFTEEMKYEGCLERRELGFSRDIHCS
ncbi:hypothetical protein SSX86_004850 [Deinandra increscens subsp. villosa]|uniref:Uncharacterized protein n=1 Tax=Deinandra increscens subsp. villosa TaxID=3103831 RepID=A0AAP0H987_9ASTR